MNNSNNQNILNLVSTNKNFKAIKKLDLRGIEQQTKENDNPKGSVNNQNKSDIERENFAERQISKDLEKYIEFLSKEDEQCDKLLNFQTPYYFLGINSKQSLSSNGKELMESHIKSKEDFLSRIEKKFEKTNTTGPFNSSSFSGVPMFSAQKFNMGSAMYKKGKLK